MNRKQKSQITHDREVLGLSYRTLGKKYGLHFTTVHHMLMSQEEKQDSEREKRIEASVSALPDDLMLLKEALRKAQLKLELQDLMIDIASKELGVDIRKKSGTRQSE